MTHFLAYTTRWSLRHCYRVSSSGVTRPALARSYINLRQTSQYQNRSWFLYSYSGTSPHPVSTCNSGHGQHHWKNIDCYNIEKTNCNAASGANCLNTHSHLYKALFGLDSSALSLSYNQQRLFHTTCGSWREESKVEETLEALKDSIKETGGVVPAKREVALTELEPVGGAAVIPAKKSIRERVVAELKHYYHGFRLLWIDVKVCARLTWQLLRGQSLTRREQKQLVRTTADLFRLVPFLVIILIPFAEFALPVLLKLFPEMLPSTFKEEDKEREKRRQRLKVKLEMAKFLQDTIEETALQRQGATGESVHDFVNFIEKIRTAGVQTSTDEILKYSKLFEDEITLDNLSYDQLRAICRLVEVSAVGTSYFLRFQIQMKLRELEADDRLIQKEGVESMAVWELQEACRQRGMRSFGVSEQRLKAQLSQWLDLHLNYKIPTSLLLLSRTLYLPDHISPEDQLKATISALPETTAEEAKVKILEVTGDRVDNLSKLEVIKQEEEIIQREKEEQQKEKLAEKLMKEKAAAAVAGPALPQDLPINEELIDNATLLGDGEKLPEIATEDLGKIEDLLDHVVSTKQDLMKEVEELKALKEDITEYRENLEDVKEVAQLSGGALAGLTESKAAQRLARKVGKMVEQIDEDVQLLKAKKKVLDDEVRAKSVEAEMLSSDVTQPTVEQVLPEQRNVITVSELRESVRKISAGDSSKFEAILRVLDEDKDGVIDYGEAMHVIDLLSNENLKLNAEQLAEIMSILRKEKMVEEALKKEKQRKQQQAAAASTGSSTADSKRL